ncbi:MAG: C45 family autoproteolytic acyltransferase/hydrolase [Exilibacterium sp.]
MPVERSLPLYDLVGNDYQLGFQHGYQTKKQIRSFLDDNILRINSIGNKPRSLEELVAASARYKEAIVNALPDIESELHGLADGADICFDEALLLQLRRELVGYSGFSGFGDCSTFCRVNHKEATLAQTIDLNGNIESETYILRVLPADINRPKILLFTYTGLLGYLGLNSNGVLVGINLVLGGNWKPGIPVYMAVRHLLSNGENAEHCIELLRSLDLASSRALTICDSNEAYCVEIINNKHRIFRSPEMAHTNHFLDSEFSRLDEMNIFASNGSKRRLDFLQKRLSKIEPGAEVDDYLSLLSLPPLCIPPDGNIRQECTVARVIMRLGDFSMHVLHGALSSTKTVYCLDRNRLFNEVSGLNTASSICGTEAK